jgi:WD40 repeat protein
MMNPKPSMILGGVHRRSLTSCVWSGDNEWIMVGDSEGLISRWRRADKGATHRVRKEGNARITGLGISPFGNEAWAALDNGSIKGFPGTYQDGFSPIDLSENSRDMVSALALSPNGRRLAFTRNGVVTVIDFDDGLEMRPIGRGQLTSMFHMRWRSDGRHLATDDGRENVILWDTSTASKIQVFGGPAHSSVTDIAINYGSGSDRVMICYGSHPPREFDITSGRQLREIDEFPRRRLYKCQYGPRTRSGMLIFADGQKNDSIVLTDLVARRVINEVWGDFRGQYNGIGEIVVSPKSDQLLVATGSGNAYGWFFKDLTS